MNSKQTGKESGNGKRNSEIKKEGQLFLAGPPTLSSGSCRKGWEVGGRFQGGKRTRWHPRGVVPFPFDNRTGDATFTSYRRCRSFDM